MLPPEDYARAVREADYHIQIAIEDVDIRADEAFLSGNVVKVFRGSPALEGTSMKLRVDCFSPGENDEWPPDGIGRFPADALQAGRILEALVNETEAGMEIALGLSTVIDSATSARQLKIDFEPATDNRKKTMLLLASVAVLVFLLSTLLVFLR